MAEISPTKLDMPPHYSGDGLLPFAIDTHTNLTDQVLVMDLVNSLGNVFYRFSSSLDGENKLTINPTSIFLPLINAWALKPSTYNYDLKSINSDGFVKTLYTGKWQILPSITSIGSAEYDIPQLPIINNPTSSEETFIII